MAYQLTDMQALMPHEEPYRIVVISGDVRFELRHNVVKGVECVTPVLQLPDNLSSVAVSGGDVKAACQLALRNSSRLLSRLAEILGQSANELK